MHHTQPVRVLVRDMITSVRLGIHAHEQTDPQRICVNVVLEGRIPLGPTSIAECMDYDHIYARVVKQWPSRSQTALIETLLEELVDFCFLSDERVEQLTASITKPDVFAEAAGVGVEMTKTRAVWSAEKTWSTEKTRNAEMTNHG